MSLVILHSDNHLLAVEKSAGLPTVPDESGDESLFDLARAWVEVEFDKPGRAFLGVVHRLDRPVSGVVLFARTSKAAARLTNQFRERTVKKSYLGICEGVLPEESGRVEHWLFKDRSANRVVVREGECVGAKQAVTTWRVLHEAGGKTLVELHPETGRSHQLRVAVASLGAPLSGDLKYGAPEPLPDKSVALHARSLEVEHPTLRERLAFEAELPSGDWWRIAAGRL